MASFGASYLENLGRNWQRAYLAVNGKTAPEVIWKSGWFLIDGKRYRRSTLEAMHTRLQKRANAGPLPVGNAGSGS